MTQRRGGLDLLHEALGAYHGGEFGLQHLDRHHAVVPNVMSEVNGRHPARAELTLDAVTPRQRGGQARRGFVHCFGGPAGCFSHTGGCSALHVIAVIRHELPVLTIVNTSAPQCDHTPLT